MNTFNASATFPSDKVIDLAHYLGYQDTITNLLPTDAENTLGSETVPNPQSVNDFIAEKFKTYCIQFAAGYAIKQVNDQIEIQRQEAIKQANDAISQAIEVTVS